MIPKPEFWCRAWRQNHSANRMSNGAATASSPTSAGVIAGGENWTDFCDRQARYAAQEFARAFCNYVNAELTETARANLSYKDFLRKFFERFCDHFEVEYSKRSIRSPSNQNLRLTAGSNNRLGNSIAGQQNNSGRLQGRTSSNEEFSSGSNHSPKQNGEKISPKSTHKPFFRRLSFKGLKKGKGFFLKQQSDETEQAHPESRKGDKQSKTKLSKIVVECRKEGYVNAMVVESTENVPESSPMTSFDNTDGSHQFEKCRLSLVRASAGYMLEFFYSSRSKPRYGIFCSTISETRETTALEMPDKENTFVLKTREKREFIIEAKDPGDMKSWLATIRYCIRDAQAAQPYALSTSDFLIDEALMHGSTSMHVDGDRTRANSASKSIRSTLDHTEEVTSSPPELPPRLKARSSSNLELCSSQQEIEQLPGFTDTEVDLSNSLREFPWFHGTLPRNDATGLVLHKGTEGHGTFLVRQSETRKGEYVLSFNFQGKAKHLRMTLNDQGCRVQHLCFTGIHDMLDHFRQHPIPLETGGTADVKLTEYIVANYIVHAPPVPLGSHSLQTQQPSPPQLDNAASLQQHAERRAVPLPEPREVQTFAGSIRLRTESLERIEQQRQQHQIIQETNTTSDQQAANRAVQNAYSFL